MNRPLVIVPVVALFLVGILFIWAITGGLWEPVTGTLDFRKMAVDQIAGRGPAPQAGEAERITDFLFGGWGLSRPPPVKPNDHQLRIRAQIAAEKPMRIATQSRAIEDLRQRMGGIPAGDIVVISWSERTWLDSALGCASPGDNMVPANIPGWMFVLRAAQDQRSVFIYNADRKGLLRFCRKERKGTE